MVQLLLLKAFWQHGREALKDAEKDGWETVLSESKCPSEKLPPRVKERGGNVRGQRTVPSHKLCERRIPVFMILMH
jgi:hypothetical protein